MVYRDRSVQRWDTTDNNHVLILQTKYRSAGAKEPSESISHFQSLLKRLSDPLLKANQKLLDQLSSIDWKNDSFELVYVTFGSLDNQAQKIAEMRAYRAPLGPLVTFFAVRSWAGCISHMSGFYLRQAHHSRLAPAPTTNSVFGLRI
jgi:lipopolysaccharide export LptBFGC system permease protein LptF